jgi:hypothetical protein
MMDGEKRIVTFMGEAGRKTASIIWRDKIKMFEVFCEDAYNMSSKFFTLESEAQEFAEEFVWEKKYGTV